MPNQKFAVQRIRASAKKSGEFLIGNDLRVTRLGFGAMRITGDGVWGEPADRAEAVRVLRRAVELGINFIDTADSYGPGVSEEIIAEALHPYPTGLVIATKGGYVRPGPNQWVENGKPEHLRSACEASLRRLRLERIDLYQLHRIDPKVPAEDQLGTLKDLQAQGKIRTHRFIGSECRADSACPNHGFDCERSESLQRHRPGVGRCSGILRTGKAGIYSVVPAGGRSCFRLRESYWSYRRAMESYPIPGGSGMAAGSISSYAAHPGNFQGRTSRRKCGCCKLKDRRRQNAGTRPSGARQLAKKDSASPKYASAL